MPVVHPDALTSYLTRIFEALGAPNEDAKVVAGHLVEANLKGHDSHGVIRTPQYVERVQNGRLRPGVTTEIEQEAACTALVNGNWNFGQVVGRDAMAIAIGKARTEGVGIVTCYQSGHAGRIGTYGEQAAAAGMVSIACVNVHGGSAQVAPFGGSARRLSTNPIVIAGPTTDPEAPFVLDMATSVVAEGKVRVARNRGTTLPSGWILDGTGAASTDPLDLYGGGSGGSSAPGMLLPLGGQVGYKGFGLSLAVELLAGALTPAGTTRPDGLGGGNALFMLAIDPERFTGRGLFEETLGSLLDYVKKPPYAEGFDGILVPGEPERRCMAERISGLPLDGETLRQVEEAAASVGVGAYDDGLR